MSDSDFSAEIDFLVDCDLSDEDIIGRVSQLFCDSFPFLSPELFLPLVCATAARILRLRYYNSLLRSINNV